MMEDEKKTTLMYRIIKGLVQLFYPKMTLVGAEHLPEGECIIVGNHAQMNGPIASELFIPGRHHIWCAGEMMHLKDVPDYAFRDFWSGKPKYIRWFYRLLSYIIAPLSVCVFNNAHTIGVYHDARILSTFKETVRELEKGSRVVIFPEKDGDYNHILCQFQDRFIDVAKLYYKRTGKEVVFVPMYLAPRRKEMHFGEPIRFCAGEDMDSQRQKICGYLMDTITRMAVAMPEHKVVPYRNVPKKQYPSNICKEIRHEKAGG